MGYSNIQKATPPGLGGWTYQGDVALGDPPVGSFYVDQTSMSSGTPTVEINVTDSKGIDHVDWLQDLVNTNHLILRNRVRPSDSLIIELSSNTPGAGFQTLVGTITSGSGTFLVGATYDIWAITTAEDLVVGPASSVITSIPTFPDTTGTLIQNNTTLQYDTGEVQLAAATTAIEIQERTTAPASAVGKGHVWVRDDAPNTLIFTDDLGTDIPIVPPNTVVLGEWTFGGSSLGVTTAGEFETDNATLTLITAIRFNSSPSSGQAITNWADLLPQAGILYLQDISDPGGTSVTFPYLSITFPLGSLFPQFNGNVLAANGTVLGTNWSANDYSLQIVPVVSSLDAVINSPAVDNDVTVLSTDPIILRDNAVDFVTLTVTGSQAAVSAAMEIERDTTSAVAVKIEQGDNSLSLTAEKIVPGANISVSTSFDFIPQSTSEATTHGVDVVISGGDHSGTLRGGNLTLDAGASSTGTDGIVRIGFLGTTEEIVVGSSGTPGVTITEGTDHPVAPAAGRAQLWVKSDYVVPTTLTDNVNDGQGLMMTTDTGLDINLSWLAANYKPRIGGMLALAHIEEQGIFAGGTTKSTFDTCVSYIYDWLSNMWYQAFVDNTTADALITSSDDGGYTWVTSKVVDTSIAAGDLAPPCTNGTLLGVAADGAFYLSTDLTATNLPGTPTGSPASMTGSTGLVWSVQASLWVMCGDNGTEGHIYTSPDGITWSNRTPSGMQGPSNDMPVSMDIAHTGFGGFEGTERIIAVCGGSSTSVYYSTNGGVTWNEDTLSVPTIGLECIVWAPSIGNGSTEPGCWMGIDASSNLWLSAAYFGGTWYDTTVAAGTLFRAEEFAGYGNTSTNKTWYQITTNSDSATDGFGQANMGVTWQGMRPLAASNVVNVRGRYQYGNGVIMWDRFGDFELVIGRYGPIKP